MSDQNNFSIPENANPDPESEGGHRIIARRRDFKGPEAESNWNSFQESVVKCRDMPGVDVLECDTHFVVIDISLEAAKALESMETPYALMMMDVARHLGIGRGPDYEKWRPE